MELSTTYVPLWLQRAMSAPFPTRVSFPDSSYVSVFPGQGRYDSNIEDWAAPSLFAPDAAEPVPLADGAPAGDRRLLIDLRWTLILQGLSQQQGQPQDYPFRFSLVRLVSWPSLIHLPPDIQPAVARLCALLARKPSAASLLPLLLELPESQVFLLIEALRLHGHLQVSAIAAESDSAAGAPAQTHSGSETGAQATPSLVAKIWQRLIART